MTRRDAGRLAAFGVAGLAWCATVLPLPKFFQSKRSRREQLEELLGRACAESELPGLAAAIVRGGRDVLTGVAGVRLHGGESKILIDDRFHIASCTKSWTATLAALAVERGRLRWSTTLAEALPDLAPRIRKEYAAATLEKILAHEAGIPAFTRPTPRQVEWMRNLSGSGPEQRKAFLATVLTGEPNSASGEGAYSNVGYAAAGAMIEASSGAPWEDLIEADIVRPLGLSNVGFGYPATAKGPDQPRGHARDGGAIAGLPLDESRALARCLWPAGAVHCSIGDLATYAKDHLDGLRGRRALLKRESYERIHRRRGESVFTLGWGTKRDKRWGVTHFGSGSGGWFFVRIVILPDHDLAVAMASNSGDASETSAELWPRLAEDFGS